MIDFTRAFDSAWERMMVILFRPFDFGKWLIIGLSAFLAGLLQGGNGFNGGSFNNFNNFNNFGKTGDQSTTFDFNQLHSKLDQFNSSLTHLMSGLQVGIIIVVAAITLFIILALVLLMYWLGSRGQFLLLDNIVRNRGNISWPWQYYARQANSLFGIYLLFVAISFVVIIPMVVVAVLMMIPLFKHDRWPEGGEIAGFIVLGVLYFGFVLVFSLVLFVFREFGVPLMFRNRLMARPAFVQTMELVMQHPGSVAVFILLRFALAIAVAIVSIAACCACCIGVIPYVGTVAILPALIYVRCFTLDCLAQFGPQYDVWTVDVPPSGPGATSMITPQPPRV